MAFDTFGLPTALLADIGGIEVDATISENHRFNSLVTANPIEDGSIISDHIVNLPVVLDMEGRFTDTPFGFIPSIIATGVGSLTQALSAEAAGAAAGVVAIAVAASLLSETRPSLAKSKFQFLVALQVARDVIDVVTGLQTYQNMVIESLSAPRVARDGASLRFNATFREILVAGDVSESNRKRIIDSLWASAITPRQLGIIQKAQATFNPVAQSNLSGL